MHGLLLFLTLPRQWVLTLQRGLPAWLTNRPGWRPMPDEDPLQGRYPACLRAPSFCPDAPNLDGGCTAIAAMCIMLGRLLRPSSGASGSGGRSGNGGGVALGGSSRGQSRLLAPTPVVPSALNPLTAIGPPSPSMSSPRSLARPSSTPLQQGTPMGDGPSSGGGSYARLQGGDDVDSVGDDVEAQLLNMRANGATTSSSSSSARGSAKPAASDDADIELALMGDGHATPEL